MHPAAKPLDELLSECDEVRTRRSGPGGQNRNKVETAVVLTHRPTGLIAQASERRSQAENRAVALFRLRIRLALEVRLPADEIVSPSPLWQSRCRTGRIEVNAQHNDFPALLAESLNITAACHWDVSTAAEKLSVSTTQLVRLFKQEPTAFQRLNEERHQRRLPRLK